MNYTAEILRPCQPVLNLGKISCTLKLLTLEMHVYFTEKYGSINEAFNLINKDLANLPKIIWELIIEKDLFNHSEDFFIQTFLKSNKSSGEKFKELNKLLNDVITKSMPSIQNKKRYEDFSKIKSDEPNTQPCYGVYYDTLAARYNYSLDDFYGLTLRQLHILLNTVSDQKYSELEVQAALAGRKLKPRMKFNDISEEQEKSNEQEAQDALARLQKQYEERKNK